MGQKCRICGSACTPKSVYYDDRYGYPGSYQLDACTGCGHRTLSVNFTPEQLTRLYSEFYPRSSFSVEDFLPAQGARGFNAWLEGRRRSAYLWVPERVRVLDIGCGFGQTLGYHVSRGCDAYGVEADENIRRVADAFGFNVQVGLFDPGNYEEDYFDYVTMDQVIEHVTDPIATLKGVARVLRQGGMAIVSTPNANGWGAKLFGRRWINWHAPYHLQHFSKGSMELAARQAGLTVEKTTTITSSAWLYYQWIHLVTYPEMGRPSPFWSPGGSRSLRERLLIALLSIIHKTKINHLITRFFDALGIGDNHLFFLRKNDR